MSKPLTIGVAVLGVLLVVTIIVAALGWARDPDESAAAGSKIVGGRGAVPGSIPYQAYLLACSDKGRGCFACGATVIHKRYAITAAHCLNSGQHSIVVGEHDLCDGYTNEGGKIIVATKVTGHPDYNPRTIKNDIAVIELSEDIQFNDNIKPACLSSADTDASGLEVTISGWGGTRQYDPEDCRDSSCSNIVQPRQCTLKEGIVKVLEDNDPLVISFDGNGDKTGRLFAFAEGVDTCQGDSGGPIVLRETNKDTLLGATSYGAGCASRTPGVYAKISDYLDFIEQHAKPYFEDAKPAACGEGGGGGQPATSGEITSTNYPGNYDNNLNQNYPIIATPGKIIKVTFVDFDVEDDSTCRYDHVTATDGDGTELMAKTCGAQTPPPFTSKTNKVNFHLKTDYSVRRKGFRVTWEEVGDRVTSGELQSPNYPSNYPNYHRSSEVVTVAAGKRIELTVVDFDVEFQSRCGYDSVKIYEFDGTLVDGLESCGTMGGGTRATSKRNKITITFLTDYSVVKKGFKFTWREV